MRPVTKKGAGVRSGDSRINQMNSECRILDADADADATASAAMDTILCWVTFIARQRFIHIFQPTRTAMDAAHQPQYRH